MKSSSKVTGLFGILLFFSCLSMTGIAAEKEVRLAILMPAPAKKIHKNWQPLADYLSRELGQSVKIVTPRGLEQAKIALANVDFVYANSYLYQILSREAQVSPIAQMKNTGNSIYSQGKFLVRHDSNITSIKDLKGKKIALISRYGAGSYLAPRASLAKQGLEIEKDVKVEYTKDLKKAAYMVMLGEADAAVMCEVNYDILSKKIDTGELKFFDKTDTFPEAVVFTRNGVDRKLVKRFQEVLLSDSSEMKAALTPLRDMKIGGFVTYDPAVEKRIDELKDQGKLKNL